MKKVALSVGLIVSLLLVQGCDSPEEMAVKYLARGNALYAEGELVKAGLEYRNVLQIQPKNVEALYWVGRINESQKRWQHAYAAYSRALELDKNHIGARIRIARLYLAAGQPDNAAKALEAALQLEPNNADALAVRGFVKRRNKDAEGASVDAETALKNDPKNLDAIALKAVLEMDRGDLKAARAVLELGVVAHPKDVEVRLVLARVLHEMEDKQGLESVLRDLTEIVPDNVEYWRQLAAFYHKTGAPAEAEKALTSAITKNPKVIELKSLLVQSVKAAQGDEAAEKRLVDLVAQSDNDYQLRLELASIYKTRKQDAKALETVNAVVAENTSDNAVVDARLRLLTWALQARDLPEAEAQIAAILEKQPRHGAALEARAAIALTKKNADQAIADLRTVINDKPDSPKALHLLATAHLLNRNYELAQDALENLVAIKPDEVDAYLKLAELQASNGDPARARRTLEGVLKREPGNISVQFALARVQLGQGDWSSVESTAEKIEQSGQVPLATYLHGLAYQGQEKFAESVEKFEDALKTAPESAQLLAALAQSYVKLGQPEKAEEILRATVERNPNNRFANNVLGEIYLVQGDSAKAAGQYRELIAAEPKAADPYGKLARILEADKKPEQVTEVLRAGIRDSSNPDLLRFQLAGFYERQGKPSEAIELYGQLAKSHPESELIANNLAMNLAVHDATPAGLDSALQVALRFKQSKVPAYLDTLGWIQYLRGETDAAVVTLEKAKSQGGDFGELSYHLGMAYYRQQRMDAAKKALEVAVSAAGNAAWRTQASDTLATIQTP